MYKDILNIIMFYYLVFATIIVFDFLMYFIDILFFKKYKKKDYNKLLMNIATLIGILSALLFFSYENLINLSTDIFDYYVHIIIRIYMTFLIIFFIYQIFSILNKSLMNKANPIHNEAKIITKSSSCFFSCHSCSSFLIFILLFFIIFYLFSLYNIF